MRHAALLEAARQMGGIKPLAAHLGISDHIVSKWVNLKSMPSLRRGKWQASKRFRKLWPSIERKLFALTGMKTDDLFPGFVRDSGLLDMSKEVEVTQNVGEKQLQALVDYRAQQEVAPDLLQDMRSKITTVLNTLTVREREAIKLRYGLEDGCPSTIDDVARAFKVTRERVRQIEAQAMRKLQCHHRSKYLASLVDVDVGQTAPPVPWVKCPQCNHDVQRLTHCPDCARAGCQHCQVFRCVACSGHAGPCPTLTKVTK